MSHPFRSDKNALPADTATIVPYSMLDEIAHREGRLHARIAQFENLVRRTKISLQTQSDELDRQRETLTQQYEHIVERDAQLNERERRLDQRQAAVDNLVRRCRTERESIEQEVVLLKQQITLPIVRSHTVVA